MKINDLFDAVYYINLDSRKDRMEKFWELNNKFLCEKSTIRISAFDASNSGLKNNQLDWQKIMTSRAAHATSYSSVFNHALNNNNKNILVFEDDAEPMFDDLSIFLKTMKSALENDFEMLFLGGTIQSRIEKINAHLYLVNGNVLTTHAICFYDKNNLFKKIAGIAPTFKDGLTNISQNGIATDIVTLNLSKVHKSFFPSRILYGQYESFSDIDGKNAAYNTDMMNRFEKYT